MKGSSQVGGEARGGPGPIALVQQPNPHQQADQGHAHKNNLLRPLAMAKLMVKTQ